MIYILKKFFKKDEFYPPYPTKEREMDAVCGYGKLLLSFSKNLIIDKSYWLSGNHIFEFIKIPLNENIRIFFKFF